MKHLLLLLGLLAGGRYAVAQQTPPKDALKARMTTGICDCLTKQSADKSPVELNKTQAQQAFLTCFGSTTGKEMKAIQLAYGKEAFSDKAQMRTLGEEVGALLVQNCPSAMGYFVAISGNGGKSEATAATTTGQTTGQLGSLGGPGLALLEVRVTATEKAYFVWVRHFEQADEVLRKLPDLSGRKARITWQEVELLQPDTRQYQRVREITGIELL